MTYQTKQQQALLHYLEQRGHQGVTVGELSHALREEGCPVGVATIYRQLDKLEQSGYVHKVITNEGALFQYCGTADHHRDCFLLKCEDCGRLEHVNCSQLAPLYDHLEQQHHFAINPRKTLFSGLCEACSRRKEAF